MSSLPSPCFIRVTQVCVLFRDKEYQSKARKRQLLRVTPIATNEYFSLLSFGRLSRIESNRRSWTLHITSRRGASFAVSVERCGFSPLLPNTCACTLCLQKGDRGMLHGQMTCRTLSNVPISRWRLDTVFVVPSHTISFLFTDLKYISAEKGLYKDQLSKLKARIH